MTTPVSPMPRIWLHDFLPYADSKAPNKRWVSLRVRLPNLDAAVPRNRHESSGDRQERIRSFYTLIMADIVVYLREKYGCSDIRALPYGGSPDCEMIAPEEQAGELRKLFDVGNREILQREERALEQFITDEHISKTLPRAEQRAREERTNREHRSPER